MNGPLRVLYIDDDQANLMVVRDILQAIGAVVTCCSSPEDGLEMLSTQVFHVAVLDIHMPQMSGIEVLWELRRRIGPNRATPALALTADLSRDELQYRELGFDGFIAKPVMVKSFLAKIVQVVADAAQAQTPLPRLITAARRA